MAYVSRAGRKQQIKETLEALRNWYTVYEIAKFIGVARSTKLKAICDEMVAEGVLHKLEAQHRPGWVKNWYCVPSQEDEVMYQQELL